MRTSRRSKKKTLIVGSNCPKCKAVESMIYKNGLVDKFEIVLYDAHKEELAETLEGCTQLPVLIDNGVRLTAFGDILKTVRAMIPTEGDDAENAQ